MYLPSHFDIVAGLLKHFRAPNTPITEEFDEYKENSIKPNTKTVFILYGGSIFLVFKRCAFKEKIIGVRHINKDSFLNTDMYLKITIDYISFKLFMANNKLKISINVGDDYFFIC